MDGVTILNTFVYTSPTFLFPLTIVIIAVIITIVAAMEDDPAFILGWFLAVVFAMITYGVYLSNKVERFEALVDSNIPVAEFYDTYHVVERKGDIWVLEPLEDQDDES